jgi:diguanylate cyclase (GGDEF)-like protein
MRVADSVDRGKHRPQTAAAQGSAKKVAKKVTHPPARKKVASARRKTQSIRASAPVVDEAARLPDHDIASVAVSESEFGDAAPEMLGDEAIQSLCDAYEKQIFDLRQLLEISKSLNSTLDYNILIDSILYTIMGQMKVLKAGLFAKKGLDTPTFTLHRNYKGFELNHDMDYNIDEDHPLIRLFQRDYACYTLQDIERQLGGFQGLESLASLEPTLIVPLKAKGVINGIIVLGEQIETDVFTEYEKEYVLNIALLAAIAINNAFLFEMTTTDMMTKLRMKHYFYTVLIERMEQAASSGYPLCVVMMDIDHFKKFNDTYGHSCGDAVLKQVAKIVQSVVRSNDLAARYGGEEFVVLLPETSLHDAALIAERIRESIQDFVLEYEGLSLSITISLGVAQYDPSRDITGKSVIDRADRALYMSKSAGRNRVSLADEGAVSQGLPTGAD